MRFPKSQYTGILHFIADRRDRSHPPNSKTQGNWSRQAGNDPCHRKGGEKPCCNLNRKNDGIPFWQLHPPLISAAPLRMPSKYYLHVVLLVTLNLSHASESITCLNRVSMIKGALF